MTERLTDEELDDAELTFLSHYLSQFTAETSVKARAGLIELQRRRVADQWQPIWAPKYVLALLASQFSGQVHPYTCGNDACRESSNGAPLIPTVRGWICQFCDYRQTWAHNVTPAPPTQEPTR